MSEVWFYHLTQRPLDAGPHPPLEKTLERGARAVVMASSPESVEALNGLLWTYDDRGFLPHGSAKEGFAERQPIWLTDQDEAAPNDATYLFLTDGAESARISNYERTVLLFDGRDEEAVARTRELWKAFKAEGHAISYWQQDETGRWQNKAAG